MYLRGGEVEPHGAGLHGAEALLVDVVAAAARGERAHVQRAAARASVVREDPLRAHVGPEEDLAGGGGRVRVLRGRSWLIYRGISY
jgi:hypothetical protein